MTSAGETIMRKSIFAKSALGLFAASAVCTPITATAGAELSAGVWWVYQNVTNSDFNSASFSEDLDNETGGNCADPALILYCLLYTSPSPRDATLSRMPSSA